VIDLPPLPDLGAAVVAGAGVRFRVWAPAARRVEVMLERPRAPRRIALAPEPDGYHAVLVEDAGAGDRYRYLVDGNGPFPDPCSRFQPDGPHGPSAVVDPAAFAWTDGDWPGLGPDGLVIYELHVGTFTAAGTFDAVIPELERLRELGVTAIELMPVAEFPGRRNWGYDGVDLCAPSHVYGGPAGLRRLVDAAHRAGLGVILDVVYNHLGPDGNYLRAFSPHYFTDRYTTPWGDALNYDGPHSRAVRDFVCTSACRWLAEYHLDGLRLDAVHAIHDHGPVHILAELAVRARAAAAPRRVVITAESEANDVRLIRPLDAGGYGLDAVWADDFHHAVRVHLTGERHGYYAAYAGTTAEIARAVAEGFIYQGQTSPHTGRPRGTRVTDEPARAFVFCIQNHDQVGNRAEGERLAALVDRERYLAASALLLLAPETPLLFMGQEYAATTPFLYFTDHHDELGRRVTEGRRREFAAFPAFRDPRRRALIPDPQAEDTFLRSRLDPAERARNAAVERLYRDLLALRRDDPVLRVQDRAATRARAVSAAVVAVHRRRDGAHRLALVNFGGPARVALADAVGAEAPPAGWRLRWWSGDRRYGGAGTAPAVHGGLVDLPARCAALFAG
jgi:maltooligosyltrehalose trehalohydrolase